MARAIDGERLKGVIQYWIDTYSELVDLDTCKIVQSAIDVMPTLTPLNEWVSVEERLPENYTDVLCWYEYFRYGDHNQIYKTYGIGYCIDGQWGGEVSNGTKCKVLYWQPLPAPSDRYSTEGEKDV